MEHPTKASLRRRARKILAALEPEARAAASGKICRRIGALPEWAEARVLGLYAAQASEPDLAALLAVGGRMFCFPRITGDALEFHRCDSMGHLRPGPWDLLEPDPQHCPIVEALEIDLVLIPGLAFTRQGGRLGRGGGFYDRFLGRVRPGATALGVCFHAQLVSAAPLEPHDREMDLVVTEEDVFRRAG